MLCVKMNVNKYILDDGKDKFKFNITFSIQFKSEK